ncbi:nucleotidyltransferase family protein [Draconibacterium sp.]|nr:nucleotidyltransferase family protein [Draconibacterium sp.]
MTQKSKKLVALILAAGESKRLGKPKQNLTYKNNTLLNHIKEHLTLYFVDRTFIVLGAYANEIIKSSNLTTSEIIEFKGWKEGMGSSLSYACSRIFAKNDYGGILITLGDLPLVDKTDYQKMIDLFHSTSDIVATKANNSFGVPAIFGSDYFDELLKIKGKKGAKSLIQKYSRKIKVYDNDRAAVDIDTLTDYSTLIR